MSAFVTSAPPCGGWFKETPEDFVVEELPAYLPNGEGEHLFLWVEKRGVSTPDAAKRIARQLGAQERDVSWAGLKDRQALTRQWLCVPAKFEAEVATFSDPEVRVLEAKRHRNKLKNGHLNGNRFELRVRGVVDAGHAQRSFDELRSLGVPNPFGEQRFGASGQNAARGKAILLKGGRGPKNFERKMLLSSYQSELFNRLLVRRIETGTWNRALVGDVLKKHETGGEFVCADPLIDQPRVEAFEVSPTGPMFGPEMRQAEGEVGALENAALSDEGISLESFDGGGNETRGARRFLRVVMADPSFEASGDVVQLKFSLPSGSYATVVLGELLKKGAAK